mmetsp:Transcript_47716/g.137413  ORF Transcript_47716/g.137413 Transcript_47716/m.137413 type:complete len:281 (+) Transcript_47716:512-1354(+)
MDLVHALVDLRDGVGNLGSRLEPLQGRHLPQGHHGEDHPDLVHVTCGTRHPTGNNFGRDPRCVEAPGKRRRLAQLFEARLRSVLVRRPAEIRDKRPTVLHQHIPLGERAMDDVLLFEVPDATQQVDENCEALEQSQRKVTRPVPLHAVVLEGSRSFGHQHECEVWPLFACKVGNHVARMAHALHHLNLVLSLRALRIHHLDRNAAFFPGIPLAGEDLATILGVAHHVEITAREERLPIVWQLGKGEDVGDGVGTERRQVLHFPLLRKVLLDLAYEPFGSL